VPKVTGINDVDYILTEARRKASASVHLLTYIVCQPWRCCVGSSFFFQPQIGSYLDTAESTPLMPDD